ncbi:MAG TPA: hydrogenase maturation protease [Amycolatopsis sp.]|uniref:hydrogenase maturation protease n=1 Tax=Amycolatopsis sp. TaxID=37632 RepID=UPI002B48F8AE|nr:hydrogenase maturation protease [Amycolatopsis sp.]HKS50022.1 hydrogenase maturation protease [Amycolatopsis sp.]
MTPGRVLVAGIGNVFLGDDGFGVEVVRRLAESPVPEGVSVADYGIRGIHLAYELLDGRFDTLIMVDAVPGDDPPGTVVVLEVDPSGDVDGPRLPDAHGMDPSSVLRLLRTFRVLGATPQNAEAPDWGTPSRGGAGLDRILVVGCRPAVVAETMELSEPVRAAVGEAARVALDLAKRTTSTSTHGR